MICIYIGSRKKIFSIKDILSLREYNNEFQILKDIIFFEKPYKILYPKTLVNDIEKKEVYRIGFMKMLIDHLFFNSKKTEIEKILTEKCDIHVSRRTIYRKFAIFKQSFRLP